MLVAPHELAHFDQTLTTVAGQALDAAGYQRADHALQRAGGLIRYRKPLSHLGDGVYGFVEWQLLAFDQSQLTRLQITLLRNSDLDARAITSYEHRNERTLPWVIWHVFQARILPSDDCWWEFRDPAALGHTLAASGKLLFGYGLPWLEMRQEDLP